MAPLPKNLVQNKIDLVEPEAIEGDEEEIPTEERDLDKPVVLKDFEKVEQIYVLSIDTMGQEKHRSITKTFIKGSNIVIFVYDINLLMIF